MEPKASKNPESMVREIKGLYIDIREGKLILNTEIMKILMNGLEDHILNEDMKYSLFTASLSRRR